ncbi:glycoside hydrolase family 3 protein [Patescibacteria group bacterium]|nr:glycoside hydrolase family 3 protein [Patescibacteria group bacterium]
MNTPKDPTVTNSSKYLDTTLSVDERIEDLLAQMTMAEKIGQMALVEKNSLSDVGDIATYGLGAVLSGAGAKPEDNTVEGWSEMIAGFQTEAKKSRLQIPLLYGVDAVHGHAMIPNATVFPHQIGLGATGDADLVQAIGEATAKDLVTSGVNWNYAPNLDLPIDIRWGRMYEAFSDDPLLTARLGAAYVRGLQATSTTGKIPVLATLKHFTGVGSMQWNSSLNKNYKLDQGVTEADAKLLQSTYLPPFKAAIDAGALSVMIGLHMWGDGKMIANKDIITGELKNNLGFTGFVVSDWYGLYENAGNKFMATVRGINAGVDMVMLPFDYRTFIRHMTWANRLGLISDSRIDDATRRILRAKFTLGLFDGDMTVSPVLAQHRELSRQAVAQSLVLLKNDVKVLPLQPTVSHIRVAGSAADNIGLQSGAWTVEWQGVDGNWLPGATSILDGIKKQVSLNTNVEYSLTGEFITAVKKVPLGIAVVGETPYAEGWGDREYPILSNEDLTAIKNLQASCDNVVVVIVSGRPLLIANEVGSWDTLVAAWLPGTEGIGVADVLFGKKQFMGTLPVPWPASSEQLPMTHTGETADGTPVLFPRYTGLAY